MDLELKDRTAVVTGASKDPMVIDCAAAKAPGSGDGLRDAVVIEPQVGLDGGDPALPQTGRDRRPGAVAGHRTHPERHRDELRIDGGLVPTL